MSTPLAETDLDARVQSCREIARDVLLIDLADEHGHDLPSWTPGAHIDLKLGNGLVRQYSLCGDPTDLSTYRIAVLRDAASRGGSAWIHDHLSFGEPIGVRGPRNHFQLEPAERYIFIAGGIGITPLLPMIKDVDARGIEWRMTYGGRTAASMAFTDELAGDRRIEIVPEDQYGRIDMRGALGGLAPGTLVYCCGPEPLLAAVEAAVGDARRHMLRTERFVGALTDSDSDEAFVVELSESGTTIEVRADQSILAALTEAGHDVPYSCEDGVCGSCETFVISGQPDHRDVVMSAEEHDDAGTMQICVSRALSNRLVIQL